MAKWNLVCFDVNLSPKLVCASLATQDKREPIKDQLSHSWVDYLAFHKL